jgi:tRNA nucleotidyltransferase (CCA-adding enzyme)
VVEPGADLAADLRRRDFTINAMAIPLQGEPRLIDPHNGQADLATRRLRVLHDDSFSDDPTRAIRAARYAARFGFELEPHTAELLRRADLDAVSADRREGELLRLAGEPTAVRGFGLLAGWGLLDLRDGNGGLLADVAELLGAEPWAAEAPRDRAILAAALGPRRGEETLAGERPRSPSDAVELASGRDGVELVLARALGAEWLDHYLTEWRDVSLEIDGADLLAAGLEQGPALGRGLQGALRRKLDGAIGGRDEELAVAVAIARGGDGVA